jgi:formylglycine-generating enzyme required for sulfatase activity
MSTLGITLAGLLFLATSALAADDPPAKLKLRDPAAATGSPKTVDKDPATGMEFVFVKGGCYKMGSTNGGSDEKPVHDVCVSDFSIGKYEVTQGQYAAVMGSNPSKFAQCGPDCPVETVSWNDAQTFIGKLNAKGDRQYRLPTEAEWEYAARSGGKEEKWAGTNDEAELGKYAWYDKNSEKRTHRVGLKKKNGLGIHDMSGNVWEWCQDWYNEAYYEDSPKDNPPGADIGEKRVLRGGSWDSLGNYARAAYRFWYDPAFRDLNVGLRLVLPAK